MKKIVTIGTTAMMGFTALGGLQVISHAAEKQSSAPSSSVISTISKNVLGTVEARAAEAGTADISQWSVDTTTDPETIELTEFLSEDVKDIVVPTLQDFQAADKKYDSFKKVQIDLAPIGAGLYRASTESFSISNNGDKVSLISSQTNLSETFKDNHKLKTIDLANADLSDANDASLMFKNCPELTEVNLSSWGMKEVTDMSYMFAQCPKLAKIVLSDDLDWSNCSESTDMFAKTPGSLKVDYLGLENILRKPTKAGISLVESNISKMNGLSQTLKDNWASRIQAAKDAIAPQADQTGDVQVEYNAVVTPGEPYWYAVIPATITFDDDTKELDAGVKIVKADDQTADYVGKRQVDVKVKSTNAYALKDGAKDDVAYQLLKADGTALAADDTEQDLGSVTGKATGTENAIASKAKVTGTAKETGKFVDTLSYRFTEK